MYDNFNEYFKSNRSDQNAGWTYLWAERMQIYLLNMVNSHWLLRLYAPNSGY